MVKVVFDKDIDLLTLELCVEYHEKLGLAVTMDEGSKVTIDFDK